MYNCIFCNKSFDKEKDFILHLVKDHKELAEKLSKLFYNVDDYGYFISCLDCEIERSFLKSFDK